MMIQEDLHLDYSVKGMVKVQWEDLIFVNPRVGESIVIEKRGRYGG